MAELDSDDIVHSLRRLRRMCIYGCCHNLIMKSICEDMLVHESQIVIRYSNDERVMINIFYCRIGSSNILLQGCPLSLYYSWHWA